VSMSPLNLDTKPIPFTIYSFTIYDRQIDVHRKMVNGKCKNGK